MNNDNEQLSSNLNELNQNFNQVLQDKSNLERMNQELKDIKQKKPISN